METLKRGMKRKTITKILYYKVNKWLQSINDIDVRELAAKNTIVTGGSIASMLLGETVNDYDIYFKNKETVLAITNYYLSKAREEFASNAIIKEDLDGRIRIFIPSDGIEGTQDNEYTDDEAKLVEDLVNEDGDEIEKPKYRVTFLSENAITLSDQFQLIIRFYGEPEEIHNNYDFVHAMNYYDFGNNELVLKPEALEAILSKTLVYKGSLYPICSVLRTRKFINRGWRISAGQILKMCFQISELDLNDVDVLREQLTGVDYYYFRYLIAVIEEHFKEKNADKIDALYIAEVIDRIFKD